MPLMAETTTTMWDGFSTRPGGLRARPTFSAAIRTASALPTAAPPNLYTSTDFIGQTAAYNHANVDHHSRIHGHQIRTHCRRHRQDHHQSSRGAQRLSSVDCQRDEDGAGHGA